MKQLLQVTRLMVAVITAGFFWQTHAQDLQPVANPPRSGTFYSAQFGTNQPPLPYCPPDLQIFSARNVAGDLIYIYDDTAVDYSAMKSMSATRNGRMGMNGPDSDGDGGGSIFSPQILYGSNDLWLEIVTVTNGTASSKTAFLVIHTPDPNGIYDLLASTNLGLPNWTWVLRTTAGQTNLVITNLTASQEFFILGTMNDTDSDSLTDAYERLVSHTDPNNPDTDGDGLADGLELQLGFDPKNAYSQDSTHTFKDGAWYLTAVTEQTGTRRRLFLDSVDSYYDPSYGVTFLYFVIPQSPASEKFDIYIQTPSIDCSDSGLVWQDMFFDFSFYDWFDGSSNHWFERAWFGNVPLDGSVEFAALDSQDRDSDGLQDRYEIMATHTIVGAPSSDISGVADGDANPGNDDISNLRKWQCGLNPLIAVGSCGTTTNGLPGWFTNYITFWYGPGVAGPWDDPDGDHVPNIVEYELGTDPTIRDFWGYLPPPMGDESQQFVSIQIPGISYSADDSPSSNQWFTTVGLTAGPLGAGCGLIVEPSNLNGAGTANFNIEIWPLNQAYSVYAPFTATADPSQGELQEPDPADGELYRGILFQSTDIAHKTWTKIEPTVLQTLRSTTLEYVHAVSMMKVQLHCRQIQYYQYLIAHGANESAMLMRIRKSTSIIHTEVTKITAIDIQYVHKYPNLDWIGRSLRAASFLACGASWYYSWPALMEDIRYYKIDVRNHSNTGAADILSSQAQAMLQDLPGLPNWFVIGLDPTIPIFSLIGPLGWYDGY